MLWSILLSPVYLSAGLVQRLIGSPLERGSTAWEDRLHLGDFVCGVPAVLAAGGVALFAVIAWSGSEKIEHGYVTRAAAALEKKDFPEAVVAAQRLVEINPADRKYRYMLALAHAGAGDAERAVGLMQTLAPADADGMPQAQLWVAERKLATLTPRDAEALNEVESRLIRLRSMPDVGAQATILLVRLYFLSNRAALVLNEPTLRTAAASVPELHLSLLQASVGRMTPADVKQEAEELRDHFVGKLKTDPADLTARRSAISSEILLGNFTAGVKLLREGLTLHPNDEHLQQLWAAAAVAQVQAAQFSGASPELRKRLARDAVHALQMRPQPGEPYALRLAQMQRLAGNDAEAERNFRIAAEKIPVARLELGELLSSTDRKQDAAAEFEKLLAHCRALPEAERDAAENQILVGAALVRLAKWDEATKVLTPLAAKVPEAKGLLLQTHLGVADEAATKPADRLAALAACLKVEPFFQPALQRLLKPLGDDETNAAARKMIIDLAAHGDAPAAAYLLLGTDALLHDDPELGEKYLELAHRAAPESPVILNNLAWTLTLGETPDFSRALALVQAADAKLPNNPQIQDTHGRILVKLGRWKDALQQFQACAKAYDDKADFHRSLSEVYANLKLPELSKRHNELAAEITEREKKSQAPTTADGKLLLEKQPEPTSPTSPTVAVPREANPDE